MAQFQLIQKLKLVKASRLIELGDGFKWVLAVHGEREGIENEEEEEDKEVSDRSWS